MLTDLEERQLRNRLESYKSQCEAMQIQLDKLPKGSFIALQLIKPDEHNVYEQKKQQKHHKGDLEYNLDLKLYIDDHAPVRVNNMLTRDYKELCDRYTGGKCQYIEEGILKHNRDKKVSYDL